MQHFRILAAALVALFFVSQGLATVMPSDRSDTVSLDGAWRFKLEQAGDQAEHASINAGVKPIILPAHFEPFQQMNYHEDSSWHDLKVPANWEMYGYSPATYGQPDNAIGIYRMWVKIPANWKGRIVKLNFDGVQNGAEIYLNGQPVNVSEPAWGRKNYHEGGWDAFQVDLTPVAKFGEKNLLAIRVYKNTKSVNMDTGDFFFLGGIHRDVTLFSVPRQHVEDMSVRTSLMDGGKAQVQVLLKLDGGASSGTAVMQLKGEESPVSAEIGGQTNVELKQTLANPRLWSAEKPNLYDLSIDLKDGDGKVIEHIEKKIGVRQVSIRNGVFRVNNVPVKLAGICRHDIYPTLGTALNESVWKKDITLMKAANINAIRTSHYPYGSKFYDLCDQMGMYVVDEMAACWVPTDTDELTPRFAQHARELVARDKNHPCVVIWAVGNENKVGKNNGVSADIIKQMDPTRPRLVSVHDSNALEGNVEFDDRHYPSLEEVHKLLALNDRRAVYPLILMENPNVWDERNGADYGSLDLFGAVMVRNWDIIWNEPHIPGSFLWEWQDRAVADPGPVHLYDYDPKTGINLAKVKGLVGGYRDVRADMYQVKMTYAPIVVAAKAPAGAGHTEGGSVTLHITNRYSFTNLSELKTHWRLLADNKEIKSGKASLSLAPLASADMPLALPAEALGKADALQIGFDADNGNNVATYQIALKNLPQPTLSLKQASGEIHFPHLNLVARTMVNNPTGWHSAERYPAHLENISVNSASGESPSEEAALYGMNLSDVRSVDADVVLPTDMRATPPRRKKGKKGKAKAAVAVPTGGNVAHVHVTVSNGKFTYHIDWKGTSADIQELGWAFEMPKAYDHFSWNRQSYWSWYPSDNVGRPTGTATPDSARQDITRITRPDAFDFNSTKYNCNWAMLANTSGTGIGIDCAAGDREHCRADFTDNGYKLVVNRYCCPPRDLSMNIVPDLYLMPKAGAQINGEFHVGWVSR